MANLYMDTRYRRTKCSSLRKGPPFSSWILCILIKCLITLTCVYSKCRGVDITVAAYPNGDISIPYGSPLEIFCTVNKDYSVDDIEITLGKKILPVKIINSTTVRYYEEQPRKQLETYYCKNKSKKQICISRVLIDSPPANVSNFKCLSKNLDILTCSWISPETNSTINYNLTFLINGNSVQSCHVESNGNSRYCKWNTTSYPRYRQQEEKYFFHLKSCNFFGCNEQNFTIDHFSIVKPDAPSDLKVLSNGTHSVVLQWSIPNNMVDLLPCGVDHRIEYQIAKIDNTAHFHHVNASYLPPNNKTYRFQLNDLPYAHMQYEVRVYIKSKKAYKEKFWSDFSYIVFYTASERPRRPPDTTAGAFTQATYNDNRVIYVYWKQVEEYEEAAADFTYKVLISQDNRKKTLFPDKNKSLSYVILNEASLGAIDVTIWSSNMNGSSVNSSHLYIPPERDTHSFGLTSFTKLAYENGTYELSWDGIENIDNYTLFWCQHNTTKICTGRLNFTVLQPNKSKYVIDLPRDYRYQFAISVNNGTRTSGMVWAKCDISKDGIAMYGFPLHLEYGVPGKTFVKLGWSMDCALRDGTITGYNITYCPVVGTSSFCDNTVGNQSVYISDPKKMDINITNLLPFRTYQFTIALNTTYGLKTIENTTARITTSEDKPTSPRNITISDVKSNSLVISWDPPLQRNGNIGKYVIYNFGKEFKSVDIFGNDVSRREVVLNNLQGFTNYSLTVAACNIAIGLCSDIGLNDAIFVRTRIGPPSKLKTPIAKNRPDILKWEPPEMPGGTVDLYQIQIIKDNSDPEILNTTNLSYSLAFCDGVMVAETYQVRAVNLDEDPNHGALADKINVILPIRQQHNVDMFAGEWSDANRIHCKISDRLTTVLIIIPVFAIIGLVYCFIKLYKKYRKMEDIKPVLPNGLNIPEKDVSKYAFGGWNPSNKEDKPSSDEMLLLPSSKTSVSSPEIKQKNNDNCGVSDHTDSTALSDISQCPVDRQVSTSDDGSNSSLELEHIKIVDKNLSQEEDTSSSTSESSPENTPYFSEGFRKNPTSGYVQPVVNPVTGYVPSTSSPVKNQSLKPDSQPANSSYVMAGLPPPIFTTGVTPPSLTSHAPLSSGYVHPEDAQARSKLEFPKLGPSPTKSFGPESLPIMPTLPQATKHGADSSYIQLQSLDALSSLKAPIRNTVPIKPTTSSGYISPGDAVLNKHLNNIFTAGQPTEESAIIDPTMSPDAYCRFSWSTDPAKDNLHSLLSNSPTISTPKI